MHLRNRQVPDSHPEIPGSEDDAPSEQAYSRSSTPDSEDSYSDPDPHDKKRKRSHSQPAKIFKKIRSVTTVDSRTTKAPLLPASLPAVATPGIFHFMPAEWYQCGCLLTEAPLSHTRCHVLAFFDMFFYDGLQVIVCNTHGTLVPIAEMVAHLTRRHDDWQSSTKTKDSKRMAQHMALTCHVHEDQSAGDVLKKLPEFLDEPLVRPGSNRWNIETRFRCPAPSCDHWETVDKRPSGKADGYIRRHLQHSHPGFLIRNPVVPARTQRINLAGADRTLVFELPADSDDGTAPVSSIPETRPPFSLPISPATSQPLGPTFQIWPSVLGWVDYEKEILAQTHIVALRRLISLPVCTCSSVKARKQHPHFLDEGLHQCRHALYKYLESAMSFSQGRHKKLTDILVARDTRRAVFRSLKSPTKYADTFMRTISLVLRFLHVALTEGTSTLGVFKLKGNNDQFTAALELYRLLAQHQGNPPEDALAWRLHELLRSLWKSHVWGGPEINSPTDQAAFIQAYQAENLYRIPSAVQSFLTGVRYNLQCIALNHVRIVGGNLTYDTSPFYHPLESEQPDPDELSATADESGDEMDSSDIIEAEQPVPLGYDNIDDLLARLDSTPIERVMDVVPGGPLTQAISEPTKSRNSDSENSDNYVKILSEHLPWLDSFPEDGRSTPFSRVRRALAVVTPYSQRDGTTTRLDIDSAGQILVFSRGTVKSSFNLCSWSSLLQKAIKQLDSAVRTQLPLDMDLTELYDNNDTLYDDLSSQSPHLQFSNEAWFRPRFQVFREKMLSAEERKHKLIKDGKLDRDAVSKYIAADQEIRGLVAILLAFSSGPCMRSFQYSSILVTSTEQNSRNVWFVDGRLMTGKPIAKQLSLSFADSFFPFPRQATAALVVLFFYQQSLICDILCTLQVESHLYASHAWPVTPSLQASSPSVPKSIPEPGAAWSGGEINKVVKSFSTEHLGVAIDCPLIRQLAEGILRDKVPLFFGHFYFKHALVLANGHYCFTDCLSRYAIKHKLGPFATAQEVLRDRVAACMLVADVWQAMHALQEPEEIWKPVLEGAFMLPSDAHDKEAYAEAQTFRRIAVIYGQQLDFGNICQAWRLLGTEKFPAVMTYREGETDVFVCAKLLLRTIRTILFGNGRPRYGQTPPIGGILLQDLLKAGAFVLYSGPPSAMQNPEPNCAEVQNIIQSLRHSWESGANGDIISISKNVFDMAGVPPAATMELPEVEF